MTRIRTVPLRSRDGQYKLEFGIAVFKGLFEPVILIFAQSPIPLVADVCFTFSEWVFSIWFFHRVLERIQDNKQRIAPCPGIVVFTFLVTAEYLTRDYYLRNKIRP